MEKTAGRVLKADEVKVRGSFHLDAGQPSCKPANTGSAVFSATQACIVEKTADFAVLEITCGCGAKTRIRCEYNDITN